MVSIDSLVAGLVIAHALLVILALAGSGIILRHLYGNFRKAQGTRKPKPNEQDKEWLDSHQIEW